MSDSELEQIAFCSLCESVINVPNQFHKTCYKDLHIYVIQNPQNNYICKEYIDKELMDELWFGGHIGIYPSKKNKKLCGQCIEDFRPYIHYIQNEMFMIFPSTIEFDVEDDDEEDEEEEDSHHQDDESAQE